MKKIFTKKFVIISLLSAAAAASFISSGGGWKDRGDKTPPPIPPNISSNPDSIPMVFVKGGTFMMGCTEEQGGDCWFNEKPARSVTVGNFSIGKTEVTQQLWTAVMGRNPSKFTGDGNLPVDSVSWDDAQGFIRKLNEKTGKKYRLPTEAEWEYAARGGNKSRGYKYSGGNDLCDVAWYGGNNSNRKTHPVAVKAPNELGLYDMSGNLWEWTSSTFEKSSDRVIRGGCWYYDHERNCRVSMRHSIYQNYRSEHVGFRLALDQ